MPLPVFLFVYYFDRKGRGQGIDSQQNAVFVSDQSPTRQRSITNRDRIHLANEAGDVSMTTIPACNGLRGKQTSEVVEIAFLLRL